MDVLTFDIETIVDKSRLPLFADDLLVKAGTEVDRVLQPMDEAAFRAAVAELTLAKRVEAKVELLGAVTPEYCRIIGMNFGVDEDAPRSGWVGEVRNGGEPLTETDLINAFWTYAKQAKHLVGFNCHRFDLPAIYVRSAILGIEPPPGLNLWAAKPWEHKVLDLLALRWPYKAGAQFQSLKALRRVLDLPIPAGYEDVLAMDGGDVGALWAAGDFEKCNRYGCLDIETTRSLCRWGGGFFWPQVLERV